MTSLSSGQSTEDSWYDVLDPDSLPSNLRNKVSPPPLPARVLSSGTPSSSNRTPYKYASHSKIKLSNSLNLSNVNASYSLPVVLGDDVDLDYMKSRGDFITGEKVTCLMKAEHSHKVRRQLEQKLPHSCLKVIYVNISFGCPLIGIISVPHLML